MFYELRRRRGGLKLNKLFTLTFPDGRAGLGLLLLRVALGASATFQVGDYLLGGENPTQWERATWCLVIAGGALFVMGFLTPLAAILLGLCGVSSLLSWFLGAAIHQPDNRLLILYIITAVSAALLGPGAYSLDARLFGRREIIIPPSPRTPNS